MGMSTFFGLEIGKRGLQAHRAALDTTGHNIANASTEGYSRQRVEFKPGDAYTTPSLQRLLIPGQIGTGSEVSEISRSHSYYIDKQINNELHTSARWEEKYNNLKQVETLFNEPSGDAVRGVIDEFWKSFEDLSNDPETPATRKVAIERGASLSDSISLLYNELSTVRTNLDELFTQEVQDVNEISAQIAKLNKSSQEILNMGDNPNDILDQRDTLISELAKKLNIDVSYRGGNELVVSVSGQTLIQGGDYNPISTYDNFDNESLQSLSWGINDVPISSDENVFTGYTTTSVKNQSATIEVLNLAKKNELVSQKSFAYEELPINVSGNYASITSGYVQINDKTMYIDAQNDTLVNVIQHINDLDAGVEARLSDDGENRLILTSTLTGIDNRVRVTSAKNDYLNDLAKENEFKSTEEIDIDKSLESDEQRAARRNWDSSGSSNFFRVTNLETFHEGSEGIIDKDEDLFILKNSNDENFLQKPETKIFINDYSITISNSEQKLGAQITLEEVRDEINKETENTNVIASILKDDNGRYRLLLEGSMDKEGNNNFKVRDDDNFLNRIGINVPTTKKYIPNLPGNPEADEIERIAGMAVSGKYASIDNGVDEVGILNGGAPSNFRLEDEDGDFVDITVTPDKNDSLTEIKNLIQNAISASGNTVDIQAETVRTPEGQIRLWIHGINDKKWTLSRPLGKTNGRVLDILKLKPGEYNDKGPVNISAYNAKYTYNGQSAESNYNTIEDEIAGIDNPGVKINFVGEGQAKLEIRQWLKNGKIKGILESRDEIIPYYMKELDKLAYNVIQNINEQHYQGFGLDGKSQRNFFSVFNSVSEYDPTYRAARGMDIDPQVLNNLNAIAAASKDPFNTDANGLPITNGSGDGSNAIEIAKIKEKKILNNGKASYDEFFNEIISKVGVESQEADRINQNQDLLLTKLENERQSIQGVSLDEELSNMIKYQQAYNASAKIITTMDTSIETIIGLIR